MQLSFVVPDFDIVTHLFLFDILGLWFLYEVGMANPKLWNQSSNLDGVVMWFLVGDFFVDSLEYRMFGYAFPKVDKAVNYGQGQLPVVTTLTVFLFKGLIAPIPGE